MKAVLAFGRAVATLLLSAIFHPQGEKSLLPQAKSILT
jgi:hypothetical protein